MVNVIKPGIYKHSKSDREYRVHFVANHSETLEDRVVYEALYENDKSKFWVRPVKMFTEEVVIDRVKKPRFVFVREK